jgi:ferredoxin-NADP reductase
MPIYTLKLLDRKTVATNTIALIFEKPEGFTYKAGQYGGFTLINPVETDDRGATRRFSYSSAPDDDHIMVVTRVQQSAYKRNLQQQPLGSTIKMAGPTGNFILHEDPATPAVFIAGGIGLAPFYSIIRDTLKHQPDRALTLFYGNQTLADSAFMGELQELAQQHPSFQLVAALANPHAEWTGEKGFITDEVLVKNVADMDGSIFYVCGSPGMVSAMQNVLKELQISHDRVKVEDFPGY